MFAVGFGYARRDRLFGGGGGGSSLHQFMGVGGGGGSLQGMPLGFGNQAPPFGGEEMTHEQEVDAVEPGGGGQFRRANFV